MTIELEHEKSYILPDGTLIHVMHDDWAQCPMEMMGIPVYAYREPRLSRSSYAEEPTDPVLKIFAEYVSRVQCSELAVRLTQRYCRVFFPVYSERAAQLRLGHWQGYSQGDWLDYAYISEYDERESFELFLQGDVSAVTIIFPNGEEEHRGGIARRFGRVTGEDLELDLTGIREARQVITYV